MEKTKYDGNQIVSWDKCDWKPKSMPVKEPSLSQAIRMGIPKVKHVPGEWCGCALATAAIGLGFGGYASERSTFIKQRYPALSKKSRHPIHGVFSKLDTVIESLDGGWSGPRWTREQIADWLEGQGY